MNGFEQLKERKRASIIRAATELFDAHGIKNVSIAEIARKAGVSPITIYNHFHSKDKLIREVAMSAISDHFGKMHSIFDKKISPSRMFRAIVQHKAEMDNMFQGELLGFALPSDPELSKWMESLGEQYFTEFIEKGKSEGYINKKLSLISILTLGEILRRGMTSDPKFYEDIRKNPKLMRDLDTIFFNGIKS